MFWIYWCSNGACIVPGEADKWKAAQLTQGKNLPTFFSYINRWLPYEITIELPVFILECMLTFWKFSPQVAERNHDVQLVDFIESTFLGEQVRPFRSFHNTRPSFCQKRSHWLIISGVLSGWKHKEDIGICCPAEKSRQRTRYEPERPSLFAFPLLFPFHFLRYSLVWTIQESGTLIECFSSKMDLGLDREILLASDGLAGGHL